MNDAFGAYVASAWMLASERNVQWDLPVDCDGSIDKQAAWDLTAMAGAVPPPTTRLSDLGGDRNTIKVLNQRLAEIGRPAVAKTVLSRGWQDLIKAATVQQILVSRNTPAHVNNQVIRPLRVLGTCVQALSGAEPWAMTSDDVRFARAVATAAQASGKLGELVESVVKYILDARHLCDHGPFHQLLKTERGERTRPVKRGPQIRMRLDERKSEERLPELRALWELVRIVFTERPRTFSDALRFAQIKLLILCGLRVGEVCSIPVDWKRVREYVDLDGRTAGTVGGVSRTLMLRHFAEKQWGRDENSVLLYEAFQHVPTLFEPVIEETLDGIVRMTEPLRHRLRRQAETGRHFPEFADDEFISVLDLYTRLSGNPQIRAAGLPDDMVNEYRQSFDAAVLEKIAEQQSRSAGAFDNTFHQYWRRLAEAGWPCIASRVRIWEVEKLVTDHLPTKLSDTAPFPLGDGKFLRADELLFLSPKRAIVETRNDGICDVSRYFAVGRLTPEDLIGHLAPSHKGIFARYGETPEDRRLGLNTHALRHLQNTELFRLGIADAMITKRFNRRTVVQSYEYDHRSLAEDLAAIDLPPAARELPEKAKTVAAMIQAGKASGPIVHTFKRIQREFGDERAFEFLAAEADGFHATPYGHCINSFTIDPCPKHLQCFDGCNHLVATDIERHRRNLEQTRAAIARAIDEIKGRRPGIGRDNQLRHAEAMISSIDKVLGTTDGKRPFPDGPNRSAPIGEQRTLFDV